MTDTERREIALLLKKIRGKREELMTWHRALVHRGKHVKANPEYPDEIDLDDEAFQGIENPPVETEDDDFDDLVSEMSVGDIRRKLHWLESLERASRQRLRVIELTEIDTEIDTDEIDTDEIDLADEGQQEEADEDIDSAISDLFDYENK